MTGKASRTLVALYTLLVLVSSGYSVPVLPARNALVIYHEAGPPSSITLSDASNKRVSVVQSRAAPSTDVGARWTVREGDTGHQISATLGIDFSELDALNPGVQWTLLQVGQLLNMPGDGSDGNNCIAYTVVAGDTGDAISASYGISFARLEAYNRNLDWYSLQIGQILIIPSPAGSDGNRSVVSNAKNDTDGNEASKPSCSTQTVQSESVAFSTTDTEISTVPVVDASMEVNTSTKSVSPSLTPDETPLPLDQPDSHKAKARQVMRIHQNDPETAIATFGVIAYKVKAGDTGYSIAAQFGVSFNVLATTNPGTVWTNLQIEQTLKIPDKVKTATTVKKPIPQVPRATPRATSSSSVSMSNRMMTSSYVTYSGPVTATDPFYPNMSNWISFDRLWNLNLANIGTSCNFAAGLVAINSASETASLRAAILEIASRLNVDASFILAVILQESKGCVRVPTTNSWEGIQNPGLMQSFKGRASCNSDGRVRNPCPNFMIKAMITDGMKGRQNVGILPALQKAANQAGTQWPISTNVGVSSNVSGSAQVQSSNTGVQSSGIGGTSVDKSTTHSHQMDKAMYYYQAARIYNSGSLSADGDLSSPTRSTRCYVSDIVNRLLGWTGVGTCSMS